MVSERFLPLIEMYMKKKTFPGVVIAFGSPKDHSIFSFGTIDEKQPMHDQVLFDAASLTKVVATLPAVLTLVQNGVLDFEEPACRYVPISSKNVLIWHLLTHSSGFPPYSESYKWTTNSEELIQEIYKTPWVNEPGKEVVYSCLNYILLKKIVDNLTGSYTEFLKEAVFNPLQMSDTTFLPSSDKSIAPTSLRNGKLLKGLPDDELAFYLDGVGGNAGLFTCISDLCKYASEWLEPGKVLIPSMVSLATRLCTANIPGDKKGLGWMLHTNRTSDGALFSIKSYGHTGFTGTSLWIDPENNRFVAILSNRCFYERHTNKDDMWEFRRKVAQIAVTICEKGRAL